MPAKATRDQSDQVYRELKAILAAFAPQLAVQTDDDTAYYLNTNKLDKNKKPIFFGGVNRRKNAIRFHLMPVYVFADLLSNLSPGLKARMQGKSCFNFQQVDAGLFQELAALTRAGFERYQKEGMV